MTDNNRLVRNSETSIWRECRLKWYLTFVLGFLSQSVNPHFWLGTNVHHALSEWHLKRTNDPAHLFYEIGQQSIEEERENSISMGGFDIDPENLEELEKYLKLGTVMLEGYQEWDKTERDFDVMESEISYYVPLQGHDGQNFTFVARLDLLTENSEGIRPIDWKTAADFRARKTVDQDMQFRRYPWLLRIAHPDWKDDVIGSIWVGLRKIVPSERSKPPYFAKEIIDLTPQEFEFVGKELIAEVTAMMRVEEELALGNDSRSLIWPSPTFDCSWKCIYFKNGLCNSWRAGLDVKRFGEQVGSWGNDPYAEYKEGMESSVVIGRREGG